MMINKNEVYVFEQPKHIISSIIIVTDNFPLSESLHDQLNELSKISDLYFIFNDFHFPSSKNINKEKFTKLYRASGMIDSLDKNLGESLFKLLDYDFYIFKKHIGYLIFDTDSEINKDTIDKSIKVTSSTISKPILKISRLSSEEFYKIYYKENEPTVKRTFFGKTLNSKEENIIGTYCSYFSESNVMYFKVPTIGMLIKEYSSSFMKDIFVKSFYDYSNIRYLISSMIKYLGIDYLDYNLEDLEKS